MKARVGGLGPAARWIARCAPPAGRRTSMFAVLALLLVLTVPVPSLARGQASAPGVRVELGVEPREVTVGDPFRSVVRIALPAGYSLRYHDFESGDSIAATAPVAVARDDDGQDVAVYSLVAWAAAPDPGATVRIELTGPDGIARSQEIRLQLPLIRSVLPAPEEGEIVPRPPRGPIDPIRSTPAGWLTAILVLFVAALVGYLVYRYLARRPLSPVPADPRTRALEQLSGETMRLLVEGGEHGRVVEMVGLTVRTYIEQLDPELGRDLTTTELLERMRVATGPFAVSPGRPGTVSAMEEAARQLHAILRLADGVKFARHAPSKASARKALEEARAWIQRYPSDEEPAEPGRAA